MFINSDFIAAELLLSVPVLEIIFDSMQDTELSDEEMMFIIFIIAIAFALIYTFYFADTNTSRDTTEVFTVSVIEGIILAILAFFVHEICPAYCASQANECCDTDCGCDDCDDGCGNGCDCNCNGTTVISNGTVVSRNVNGNCGCNDDCTTCNETVLTRNVNGGCNCCNTTRNVYRNVNCCNA